MSKYKSLASNTVLFAISNFASRGISFLMLPLYTSILSTEAYSTVDILNNYVVLLIPVFTLSLFDAVLRFSLEKNSDKQKYFSGAMTLLFLGFGIMVLLYPIFMSVEDVAKYPMLFYLLYFSSALRTALTLFLRGIQKVRLFAIDGILTTITLVTSNVVTLVLLHVGPSGYLFSLIFANAVSVVFIFFCAKLWRYFSFKKIDKATLSEMLKYALPLIPNSISWWVANLLNRQMIIGFCGRDTNGLFAAAARLPNILMVFSTIFIQAWQLSAITEYENSDKDAFYSKIYTYYSAFILVGSSFLLAALPIISPMLLKKSFADGWIYVPFLLISITFNCLVSFLGSIYLSAKKTVMNLVSNVIGAVAILVMCLIAIPWFTSNVSVTAGALAAGASTAIGFGIIWLIRMKDTKRFVKLSVNKARLWLNIILVILQSAIMVWNFKGSKLITAGLFLLIIIINLPTAIDFFKALSQKCKILLDKRKKA